MNDPTPLRRRSSLLERAAKLYNFDEALAGPRFPPEAIDEPVPVPLPAGAVATDQPPAALPVRVPKPFAGRLASVDRDSLREQGFILPDGPVTPLAEEFRLVKRQLLLSAVGNPTHAPADRGRMILVCSAQPNEGKTFCSVNLALSMAAEKDVQVLLVDGDFAKPEVLSTLGLEGGLGIMDAIADPAIDVESCIIRTDLANLAVLPAGRRTNEATELLASERTRAVLEQLMAEPSRIVIFDSPPVLAASPASVLAMHVGQVMLVVRADMTSEKDLRGAVGLLAGCENLQLLLNSVQIAPHGRHFGHYYGYGE
jgi:protein-tyrosine kinase